MTLNRIVIYLVVFGYVIVNIFMQMDFFTGRNIWAKYYQVDTGLTSNQNQEFGTGELEAGRKAYYAKTAFLLYLLILLVFNVPFPLGFGISFFRMPH